MASEVQEDSAPVTSKELTSGIILTKKQDEEIIVEDNLEITGPVLKVIATVREPHPTVKEVREVRVSSAESIEVEIVREYLQTIETFCGGYRSRKSGLISLNRATQTINRRKKETTEKNERSTQTVSMATRAQQTLIHTGTQMARIDLCNLKDVTNPECESVLYARSFVASADMVEEQRECNARKIQSWLRVCFAQRRIAQMRDDKDKIVRTEAHHVATHVAQEQAEKRAQIERRMKPQTSADFVLLHQELQAWRDHETQRIRASSNSHDEQDKQLATLLSKEVKLLQTIDRLKLAAEKERKHKKTSARLTAMSSPYEWSAQSSTDTKVEVITPQIRRAQELVNLYYALQVPLKVYMRTEHSQQSGSSEDQPSVDWTKRLDILMNVQYVVKEQGHINPHLCKELLQLIAREEEWMKRRMESKSCAVEQTAHGSCAVNFGLRQRIQSLFSSFLEHPEINPNAQRFLR